MAGKDGYISVEGDIGVGKTTFIQYICRANGWKEVPEPVDGNPYLESFYADPKAFAYVMQDWMQSIRGGTMFHASRSRGMHVMDRSMIGDWAFAYANWKCGNMTDAEWESYQVKHRRYIRQTPPPCTVICIDADVPTLLARIKRRGRVCEQGITAEYLTLLKEGLQLSIAMYTKIHNIPVHIVKNNIDGNPSCPGSLSASFDEEDSNFEEICGRIRAMHMERVNA